MSAVVTALLSPPLVHFFAGRSESFVQHEPGSDWRRLTAEDEARLATGFDRISRVPSVGVYVVERGGRVRVGFDLWRIGVNLTPAAIERLRARWRSETAALFSKTAFRAIGRKTHFSKSFAVIVTAPECVEAWREELTALLTNPDSYEPIETRSTDA